MPEPYANPFAAALPAVDLIDLGDLSTAMGKRSPPAVRKQVATVLWRIVIAEHPESDLARHRGTGPLPWWLLPLDKLPAPALDFRRQLAPCRVKRFGIRCNGFCAACWPPPVLWRAKDMIRWMNARPVDPAPSRKG
jgi:hypothetical protein